MATTQNVACHPSVERLRRTIDAARVAAPDLTPKLNDLENAIVMWWDASQSPLLSLANATDAEQLAVILSFVRGPQ